MAITPAAKSPGTPQRTRNAEELNTVDPGNPTDPTTQNPATMSLAQKLVDPNVRKQLEKVIPGDVLEKLDKIFNPSTMPGAAQMNAVRDAMEQMKSMQEARMKAAQGPAQGAPGGPGQGAQGGPAQGAQGGADGGTAPA